MDVAETRARVPSFYALDVMRAITGRVPDYRELAAEAADGSRRDARVAGAAPIRDAPIDDLEHDLAVLKPLLDSRDPASVKGRAHYMLGLNEALRRSVISRWPRGRTAWSASDGLIKVGHRRRAGARRASPRPAARTRSRRCSASRRARTSSCSRRFIGSSRGTSRSR